MHIAYVAMLDNQNWIRPLLWSLPSWQKVCKKTEKMSAEKKTNSVTWVLQGFPHSVSDLHRSFMIRIYFPLPVNGTDWLLAVGCLLPIQLGFWQKQETVWPKQWRLSKKSARFDDPAKGWPREGSVTRKGREGPAARAAKTHRAEASKRLLEKLADSTHHF